MVISRAQGLLVVEIGGSGDGDKPTSEFVGVDVRVSVDDPRTGSAEEGGTAW